MAKIRRKPADTEKPLSPEYLSKIKFLDYIGELTEQEIEIAKEHGVLKFDLYQKARRLGLRAPTFDGHGHPAKWVNLRDYEITDYTDLERHKSGATTGSVTGKARPPYQKNLKP